MSHTTICFLAEAKSFDEAERRVTACLEGENFFDSLEVLPGQSGPLGRKLGQLKEFTNGWDWKTVADAWLKAAEEAKNASDVGMYGFYLIMAGKLYAQHLNTATYVYNIDTGDYSVPDNSRGWWLIAVDFHY